MYEQPPTLIEHQRVDGERVVVDEAERVAVGRGLGAGLRAGNAARAALVLDHERLAEPGREFVRSGAHDDVGHAAGRDRNDHPDRPVGIGLSVHRERPDHEQSCDRSEARQHASQQPARKPRHDAPCGAGTVRRGRAGYLSWSATLSIPALTQASSFSPPGAPEAPAAPITSSPTMIGTAPRPVVKPVRYCAPIWGFFFSRSSISPDGMRNVREVKAFLKLFSMVCGPVPSPRTCTITSPLRPT